MNEIVNPENMDNEPLNLQASLRSFLGTGLAPLIQESLELAGINPNTYVLGNYGHENYYGFPATVAIYPGKNETAKLSPIVLAIFEGIHEGRIVLDPTAHNDVELIPATMDRFNGSDEPFHGLGSNADKLQKLFSMSLEGLVDAETRNVLAYAVALSSDGGKEGYAIISTNDVRAKRN
ncbi:MAG: hypothetical protein JWL85_852 [Candidatus Saccharibacteria bacterium]|nr:hypothetical protein [Candidatus Saccharibacteria bacterium]